ncbi:MAG: PH domain-containing protein [Deltaproteobacteria bacterium]|nr:PH domain-containing protein [Myxococcales bacterium]MDP3216422.1 PH domain-containing protein [Deltaproteobacteria bacterium]
MAPIVIREVRRLLLGVLLLAAMPGALVYGKLSHHRGFERDDWLALALLTLPGLWFIVTGWSVLTADDDGLALRTYRGTRRAPWSAVRDFHLPEAGELDNAVELDDQRVFAWAHDQPQAEALRQLVLARATRSTTREWATRGARAVESLPYTFGYPPPRMSWVPVLLTFLVVGPIALEIALRGWSFLRPPRLNATLGQAAVVLGCLAATWSTNMRGMRDLRRRQGQRVTAREEGLRYDDGSREVVMRWEEITRVAPSGSAGHFVDLHVIESSRGSFEVSNSLNDHRRLMELIARRAPRAVEAWRDAENRREDLLLPPAEPGVKVHHYRTRTERKVLWGLGAILALLVGLGLRRQQLTSVLLESLILGVPLGLLLLRYLGTRVTTNARGITYERLGRRDSLAWSELDRWRPAGVEVFAHLLIEGRGQRWRIWGGLSDVVGLIQTLEAHRAADPVPGQGPTLTP